MYLNETTSFLISESLLEARMHHNKYIIFIRLLDRYEWKGYIYNHLRGKSFCLSKQETPFLFENLCWAIKAKKEYNTCCSFLLEEDGCCWKSFYYRRGKNKICELINILRKGGNLLFYVNHLYPCLHVSPFLVPHEDVFCVPWVSITLLPRHHGYSRTQILICYTAFSHIPTNGIENTTALRHKQ